MRKKKKKRSAGSSAYTTKIVRRKQICWSEDLAISVTDLARAVTDMEAADSASIKTMSSYYYYASTASIKITCECCIHKLHCWEVSRQYVCRDFIFYSWNE